MHRCMDGCPTHLWMINYFKTNHVQGLCDLICPLHIFLEDLFTMCVLECHVYRTQSDLMISACFNIRLNVYKESWKRSTNNGLPLFSVVLVHQSNQISNKSLQVQISHITYIFLLYFKSTCSPRRVINSYKMTMLKRILATDSDWL